MNRPRPRWLAGSSVLTAVFASACCWLPLAAALAGASAGGMAFALGKARPWLLGGSAVFLGAAFWLSYRRPACEPGCECDTPPPVRRRDRVALWFGAVVLAASALSPSLFGLLPAGPSVAVAGAVGVTLPVEGMTCETCERAVESSLRKVPGVVSARASTSEAQAVVSVAAGEHVPREALVTAVTQAGYRVPDAPLAEQLVTMEQAGEDNLTVLSEDSRELRAAFNEAGDRTRLVMLLSPT